MTTTRTVHFVTSTHWDREWYDTFQGYRARLVSLLDEVVAVADAVPGFRFFMDGQTIPLDDWLAIRPERAADLKRLADAGRFTAGPWYVMPDEFIPGGESLVRNLELGRRRAAALGVPYSGAGFVCDIFGHTGQLPQILAQHGCHSAYVWRGVEPEAGANQLWSGADGTAIPAYRFGWNGYTTCFCESRDAKRGGTTLAERAARLAAHVRAEAARVGDAGLPVLAFDGADHIEADAQLGPQLDEANRLLAADGLRLEFSDLDAYGRALAAGRGRIAGRLQGELRAPGARREGDQQWLIPGVLSSRIRLKQANAAGEDALLLWAEPLAAAAAATGHRTLPGYLDLAWRHLLENHPHDSICGCSIDQVHRDMQYRFDQSRQLAEGVAGEAMRALARAATPAGLGADRLVLTVFNPVAEDLDEPLDLEIPLPADWPTRFQEFFGYEEKFSFALVDGEGREVPWQLCAQRRDQGGRYTRPRYGWPTPDRRHVLAVTARLPVPACGQAILVVEPRPAQVRHAGSLVAGAGALDNGILRVEAGADGRVTLADRRSGAVFAGLLDCDDMADIGDGWFHGPAVNDRAVLGAGAPCRVEVVHDGPEKAVLAVERTLDLPAEFDFRLMRRSERRQPLVLRCELTLRRGGDRLEVEVSFDHQVRDHRLRLLLPTGLAGAACMWQDQAFDVAERAIAFAPGWAQRRELEVEGRPQQSWTAVSDGRHGLAVVARGLPECAVLDRPDRALALTLVRAFRRTVMQDLDAGVDSQEPGAHRVRLWLVPFAGAVPRARLCRLGQRVARPLAQVELAGAELAAATGALPRRVGHLSIAGEVVATSLRRGEDGWTRLRLFNPTDAAQEARIVPRPAPAEARHERLDGAPGAEPVALQDGAIAIALPAKRIATIAWR